jgi:uncharacterized protein
MTRRRKQVPIAATSAGPGSKAQAAGIRTRDSFQNFLTRTGNRTGNLNDGARYGFNPITRDRLLLEWAYRGSWIAGMAVDCMADDMTREGVTTKAIDNPSMEEELAAEAKDLCVWDQLCDTAKWDRLYGGAVAFMMIDGQDPETPLRADTIKQGQFKGLFPMDRWLLQPSLMNLVEDMGPDFGNPMFYDTVVGMNGGIPRMKVHYSRVIRLDGVRLPYWQRITENLWGESVLERLWDRLIAYDSATAGIAQLVYKAHLRTYKVKDLRELIAVGGAAYDGLVAQMDMIRQFQSSEGMTLMDADDEFEAHQYTFAGLPDVMDKFEAQIAGALETPRTRLFGESPGGLNSSGAGEEDQYKDTVKQKQKKIGPGVHKLYQIMYRSKFGKEPPKGFATEFKPLYQMSDKDKSAMAQQTTDAITKAYDAQIIRRETALKELKALGQVSNVFTNISDEEIKEAENDPAPSPEALGLVVPAPPAAGKPGEPGDKGAPKKQPAAA